MKNGNRLLFLVFEYLDTDLKKFIDTHRKSVNAATLPPKIIQVFFSHSLCVLSFLILHCIGSFSKEGI